jgi:short-subunit dehydrogenase
MESETSFAVITGASSGIGMELARQFGKNGFDLLICSGSDDIFEAQRELEAEGYTVEALKANLSGYNGVEELFNRIQKYGKVLDAVAINAGVGVGGEFIETSLNEEIHLINLNIVSAVHLTKRILPEMKLREHGRILYTSSISSQMPSPFEAVYGASKAFLTSFAQSIRNEAKDYGVSVTVLMPGATNTNFFHRAHMDDTKAGAEMKYSNDPAEVARQGFEALMSGKESVFAESLMTKIQGKALKYLPEKFKASFHRKWSEPGSAEQ